MRFILKSRDGGLLKTKGKYVKEDIAVGLSESDKSALVPENIANGVVVLGVEGTFKGGVNKDELYATLLSTKYGSGV